MRFLRYTALILICTLTLCSCKDFKKGFEEGYDQAKEQNEAKKDTLVEVYAFDGGTVMANNLNLFAQGDTYKGESKQLKDAFFVIKHPKGVLLWDTGLPEGLVGQEPYTPEGGAFTISRSDSIKTQLAQANIKIEDVDYIAFSHIHFDHTGGASHFADATWLVQQQELDFINSEAIKGNSFYDPSSFAQLKNKQVISNTDHDVFGDGSVVIKYMPGHTAGHQSLYLNLANNGPTLLTGDIYHFEQNREERIVPQFNYDIQQTEKSIEAFEAFAKAKNAKVIIQHDPEDFAALPVAPKSMN
ncbi:N-acyl homoserine lactonase family protein [Croceiramulus getboli]|nr:N-acyl homoserine lactonase family protein [Flavobacteriaceae bacterium YJPT1-3]